jgi:hypothetical protein
MMHLHARHLSRRQEIAPGARPALAEKPLGSAGLFPEPVSIFGCLQRLKPRMPDCPFDLLPFDSDIGS